ncbi:HipA family kinase [Erythrobacter sp. W302b]|uniref:HipA family kinase n=1 Tax=Erythrobacter sp. W302b TaxID=3389874 RepID=UPI00396B23CF
MKSTRGTSSLATGQGELMPLALTGIRPSQPQGQHIKLVGEVGGSVYYCKSALNGKDVCANEWIYSSLARHVGIPVPDFCPIIDYRTGETLFGSKETWGTADEFEVQTLLTTPPNADPVIGDPFAWLGSYLSQVYAFDVFAGNVDRHLRNFLLIPGSPARRLLAYDFASSQLIHRASDHFPIAQTRTQLVGRQLRKLRKFDIESAIEILERIRAVPISQIASFLSSIPDEWITEDQRGQVYEQWSGDVVTERVKALISGLRDGSLL